MEHSALLEDSIPDTLENTDTDPDFINTSKSKHWPQYVAVLAATFAAFVVGTNFAWPSSSVPILTAEDHPLHITPAQASYITMVGPIGNIFGCPLTALLADTIGRKWTILAMAIPHLISWSTIALANNAYLFGFARFIAGLSEGACFIVLPMYLGEVSEPEIRGVLNSFISVSFICGMLFVNCVAPYFTITTTAFICLSLPIILLTVFIWMPETPFYFVMKGRRDDARKSLKFLRRMKNVEPELSRLVDEVDRQLSVPGTMMDLFRVRSNRKALGIVLGLRTAQQCSGVSVFGFYSHTIFMQAGGSISANVCVIVYTVTQIILTFVGSYFIDKFGRKPILVISCVGSTIVLTVESVFFFVKDMTATDMTGVSWIPLVGMLLFVCVFSIGLGTVPNLMLGELFSANVKGKALFLLNIYFAILFSTIAKCFETLVNHFGIYAPFTLFSVLCFISTFFAHICVPETKGKSLEEIQELLKDNLTANKELV